MKVYILIMFFHMPASGAIQNKMPVVIDNLVSPAQCDHIVNQMNNRDRWSGGLASWSCIEVLKAKP